jgi:hypothetical protein
MFELFTETTSVASTRRYYWPPFEHLLLKCKLPKFEIGFHRLVATHPEAAK